MAHGVRRVEYEQCLELIELEICHFAVDNIDILNLVSCVATKFHFKVSRDVIFGRS
jgi:hypothetical protein